MLHTRTQGSLVERLRRQAKAIARFADTALQTDVVLAHLLQAACQAACDGSGISRAKAMLYDPGRDDLTIEAGVGWQASVIGMRVPTDERSVAGPVVRTGEPLLIEDVPNDPRFRLDEPLASHGIVSSANVAIRTSEATLGVLELDSDQRIELDGDDIDFLRSLAGLVAGAIARVRFEHTARQAAATAVTLAAEREVLHRELDHRVANHLHQVQLALRVEAHSLTDPAARTVLDRAIDRLGATRELHEKLGPSAGPQRELDMRPFLQTLARDFSRSSHIAIEVQSDPIVLPVQTGVAIGRLVNEIVMNALKHAFVGRSLGRIAITLKGNRAGEPCVLEVADDGLGMGPARAGSQGLRLIEALAAQLSATVRQDATPATGGTRYAIEFAC